MSLRPTLLFSLFVLTACSADHPLAGNWSQITGSDKPGVTLAWNGDGSQLVVHGAPRAGGGHDHPKVTSTFDAAAKTLTIQGALLGPGQPESWTGALTADRIELSSGATKLQFQRGGQPAGH
jgi:hypothetical protein